MKVNQVDNMRFGVSFVPNKMLRHMLSSSRPDRTTVRLSRRLARRWKGQEILIENFDIKPGDNSIRFNLILQNLSSGIMTTRNYSNKDNFDINNFLRDLIKSKNFFRLHSTDRVEHYLTGTKRLVKYLLNQ